jgi:thiamine transport system substrate-binding protein
MDLDRRTFVRGAGAGAAGLLAGCTATTGDTGDDSNSTTTGDGGTDTLRVGTYSSFVDAPSSSPGAWVKEEFESEHDVSFKWFAPEQQMSYFLQRRAQGLTIDTDAFIGLSQPNLVEVDSQLGDDDALFDPIDPSEVENAENIPDTYSFDPQGRVLPSGASYISLVYDENELDQAPTTFEDLTRSRYEGDLLLPSPQSSETGLMFLLWTIKQYGADGYLDYWERLADNDVRILGSWDDAYAAYSNEEAPIVVSFSTDQIFALRFDQPLARHQVGFLDGQGYAYVEGVGRFAGTDQPDLTRDVMEFVLQPDSQEEIAKQNVGFPVVENAELPDNLAENAYEPEEPVQFDYEELAGNMNDWVDEWSQQIASG